MSDAARDAADTRVIQPSVAALLAEAGRGSVFTLEPLKGGRNNRTYRVRSDGEDALLKWYFTHHHDDRDRLGTEFNFCSFLWRHGNRQIPQPLGADRSAGLGLYDFLPGRPLTPGDVTLAHHDQAIAFTQDINALRTKPDVTSLANASEACFSPAAHAEQIEQRLLRLAAIDTDDAIDREMVQFVQQQLLPAFARQRREFELWAANDRLEMHAELPREERCLSPSDFGFHNALLQDDGSLRFVDFEYAGWDEPAKLIGDFFCQIEVPALAMGFNDFLDRVARLTAHPESAAQRTRRLIPLYQIKWCGIVLNDFLPTAGARRSFSEPLAGSRRSDQLAAARRWFGRVGRVPGSDC